MSGGLNPPDKRTLSLGNPAMVADRTFGWWEIADLGLPEAVARDRALALGVNVVDGKITHRAVAEAHGVDYTPLESVVLAAV